MLDRIRFFLLVGVVFLTACTRSAHTAPWLTGGTADPLLSAEENSEPKTSARSTRDLNQPLLTPTPDPPHNVPDLRVGSRQYTVQHGDTLYNIALDFEVSIDLIMEANQLFDPDQLDPGQVLTIPPPNFSETGPGFKIIPDSELVYGPNSIEFDVDSFVEGHGGYLAGYTEDVDGDNLTGAEILQRVADDYALNPRLLLAVLEYQSGWVTGGEEEDYPMDYLNPGYAKLYRQLAWAANSLNRGYYLWRVNGVGSWQLPDGVSIPVSPTINAGTAGVQHFFSNLLSYDMWLEAVKEQGLIAVYQELFGYPFDYTYEPLIPEDLTQPPLQLPFESGVVWAFTGGPHGGWDSGSAWGALDFAPPPGDLGCAQNDEWVVAVADGYVVRSDHGAVVQSLDGDEHAQTGWSILYMHIENRDRVEVGTYLSAGDRIGHPSCEGGFSTGTHLHLARRYNGEWIPADQDLPFNLDGWVSSGAGMAYEGTLHKGDQVIRAEESREDYNLIKR